MYVSYIAQLLLTANYLYLAQVSTGTYNIHAISELIGIANYLDSGKTHAFYLPL